jgi:Bacterial low temperature requirement A protein (LtrA)
MPFDPPHYLSLDQRQRWGDTQTHPVVKYGDLFFDLFYVAGAYNLSHIIRDSPTASGFLYFFSCFWAVYWLWWDKTLYDAKFFTYEDVVHRVFSVAVVVVLASVVVHIRSVKVLSNPSDNIDPFALSLSLLLANILSAWRYVEVFLIGFVGQHAALVVARREAIQKLVPIIFLSAASIYTGIKFYGKSGQLNDGHRLLAADEVNSDQYITQSTDIPIYLILASSAAFGIGNFLQLALLPKDFKKVTIPVNVSFIIHRVGEWTMLMLGESILSLLIVASPTSCEYYVTFFCGVLSVILLHYTHFRSQPSNPDDHAIRRKRSAGHLFGLLMQAYSAALIILGVSYKMLLYEFTYGSSARRRSLLRAIPRWLAGRVPDLAVDSEDRRQNIADFFSASFAVVYFCSDTMLLVHRGLKDNFDRCRCPDTRKAKIKGIVMIILRVCIWVFMALLSQWQTDPMLLSLIGLVSIVCQIVLRVASSIVFMDERVHVDLKETQERQEEIDDEPEIE